MFIRVKNLVLAGFSVSKFKRSLLVMLFMRSRCGVVMWMLRVMNRRRRWL